MSANAEKCLSCGMPLGADNGRPGTSYCLHCTDETGALQPFEERFERMTQWAMRKDGLSREAAEVSTRAYMRTMPAWRDHPQLRVVPAG